MLKTQRFRPDRRVWGAAFLMYSVAVTNSLAAQESPEPQFRSTVELVQFQIAVTGPDGDFAGGLGTSDFELTVNGRPRPVELVFEVDLTDEPLAASSARHGADLEFGRPAAARRHFLLMFDFRYTTRRGLRESRRAALAFLDSRIRRSDLIAVATINRFGANFPIPFSPYGPPLRAAVEAITLKAATDASEQQAVSPRDFAAVEAEVAQYLGVLDWMGAALEAIPGRKHLLLFSAGFPDETITGAPLQHRSKQTEARAQGSPLGYIEMGDPAYLSGSADVRNGIERATDRLRGAGVLVHAIDARGLRFDPGNGRQSLVALASGTGGDAHWSMNDVEVALDAIDGDTSRFYVIGYRPGEEDGAEVEIEIDTRVPGTRPALKSRILRPPPVAGAMSEQQRWLLNAGHARGR